MDSNLFTQNYHEQPQQQQSEEENKQHNENDPHRRTTADDSSTNEMNSATGKNYGYGVSSSILLNVLGDMEPTQVQVSAAAPHDDSAADFHPPTPLQNRQYDYAVMPAPAYEGVHATTGRQISVPSPPRNASRDPRSQAYSPIVTNVDKSIVTDEVLETRSTVASARENRTNPPSSSDAMHSDHKSDNLHRISQNFNGSGIDTASTLEQFVPPPPQSQLATHQSTEHASSCQQPHAPSIQMMHYLHNLNQNQHHNSMPLLHVPAHTVYDPPPKVSKYPFLLPSPSHVPSIRFKRAPPQQINLAALYDQETGQYPYNIEGTNAHGTQAETMAKHEKGPNEIGTVPGTLNVQNDAAITNNATRYLTIPEAIALVNQQPIVPKFKRQKSASRHAMKRSLLQYETPAPSAARIADSIPEDGSSIFHIWDRRINFDSLKEDSSLYSLLRNWVRDDPYRREVKYGIGKNAQDSIILSNKKNGSDACVLEDKAKFGSERSKAEGTAEGTTHQPSNCVKSALKKINILDSGVIGKTGITDVNQHLKEPIRIGRNRRIARRQLLKKRDAAYMKRLEKRIGVNIMKILHK